jgi:hypothetical protein
MNNVSLPSINSTIAATLPSYTLRQMKCKDALLLLLLLHFPPSQVSKLKSHFFNFPPITTPAPMNSAARRMLQGEQGQHLAEPMLQSVEEATAGGMTNSTL